MRLALALGLVLAALPVLGDTPKVKAAKAEREGGRWRVTVTLWHDDSGWDHYASGWAVELPDGQRIGFLALTHPHVAQQPVTESLGGIEVPAGIDHVLIRPKCSLVGWAAEAVRLDLP